MIVRQNSDDEGNEENDGSNSALAQTNLLVDILKDKVSIIEDVLKADYNGAKVRNSVVEAEFVPLGPQRLHTTELVL